MKLFIELIIIKHYFFRMPVRIKPLKDRLEEDLTEFELDQIKAQFVAYLADNSIDPKKQNINKELVGAIVTQMAKNNKDWKGLPPLEDIWTSEAIDHLRGHLRNQRRDNSKHLLQKIKD